MHALEQTGRLCRANECVAQFQSRVPIAVLWGDGDKESADMMALDASRHLWATLGAVLPSFHSSKRPRFPVAARGMRA